MVVVKPSPGPGPGPAPTLNVFGLPLPPSQPSPNTPKPKLEIIDNNRSYQQLSQHDSSSLSLSLSSSLSISSPALLRILQSTCATTALCDAIAADPTCLSLFLDLCRMAPSDLDKEVDPIDALAHHDAAPLLKGPLFCQEEEEAAEEWRRITADFPVTVGTLKKRFLHLYRCFASPFRNGPKFKSLPPSFDWHDGAYTMTLPLQDLILILCVFNPDGRDLGDRMMGDLRSTRNTQQARDFSRCTYTYADGLARGGGSDTPSHKQQQQKQPPPGFDFADHIREFHQLVMFAYLLRRLPLACTPAGDDATTPTDSFIRRPTTAHTRSKLYRTIAKCLAKIVIGPIPTLPHGQQPWKQRVRIYPPDIFNIRFLLPPIFYQCIVIDLWYRILRNPSPIPTSRYEFYQRLHRIGLADPDDSKPRLTPIPPTTTTTHQ